MNHSSSWAAGSVTKVWPLWAPCGRAPGSFVRPSASPAPSYPSRPEWLSPEWLSRAAAPPCRGAVGVSNHSWSQILPS